MKKNEKIGIVLHFYNLFNIWLNGRKPGYSLFFWLKYMREL